MVAPDERLYVGWDAVQHSARYNSENNTELYVMDADGSNQTHLSNSPTNDLASIWVP